MATRKESEDLRAARAAKPKAQRVFRRYGKVQGVGVTRMAGRYALKVNLESAPSDAAAMPQDVDGVPVVVAVVGRIHKQAVRKAATLASRKARRSRP